MNTLNDALTRILEADRLNVALAELRLRHARGGHPGSELAEAELREIVDGLQRKLAEAFPDAPPTDAESAQVEAIAGASKALLRELLLHFHRAIDQTPFVGPRPSSDGAS